MKITKLTLVLIVCVLFIFSSCRKAEVGKTVICTNNASSAHPKEAALKSLIDAYVAKGLPGISLLTADSSGVWYGASGKADIEHDIDYAPCTVQKLGSITKMMMGVLTMKLVEEGKLNLDDPISKWIDADLLKDIANADKVTIRNCLQHTTGIFDIISSSKFYLEVLNNPNKHWKSDELLVFLKNEPADFDANAKALYSNSNTIFVAMCIEKITGRNHEDLLREKLLTPLAMSDTYYHSHDELPNTTAQGYRDLYNTNSIVNVSNIVTASGNGFTGVFSNVFDLQKFVKAVFIDKTYLKQSTLDSMMLWKYSDVNENFGLGLFQKTDSDPKKVCVGHTGGDLGYASEVYYYPATGKYFILCVNYGTNGTTFLTPVYDEFVLKLKSLITP